MTGKKNVKPPAQKVEGKAKGGVARAKALSDEQRRDIAKKAAMARWGAKPIKATHTGNFKENFGIDVDCYVLNDDAKTAVISQSGMARVLGISPRGNVLERFAGSETMAGFAGAELLHKLRNPLIFQWGAGGAEQPPSSIKGFEAGLLIDLCNAITAANTAGRLGKRYEKIVQQASIVTGASAKAGIQGLVYALAGYDRTKEEVIAAYKLYVMEEAREYEREFPMELYEQWYRLYGLAKPERGRPWEFRYLTIDHIYKPLAKSNGKVFALARSNKQEFGEKNNKIHQFLSEIGVKALRTQVGKIAGIAMVSESREQYEKFIAEKIYGQSSFDFGET
ncbi:P63C domain-containing protein [Cupriavidus campinensis]